MSGVLDNILGKTASGAVDTASEYLGSYTSFAGCDMEASFSGNKIGQMQGISIVVSREKAGSYTFGSADPRNFSRGKRGIAGSLVFGNYDRNALLFGMLNGFKPMEEGGFLSTNGGCGGYWGWANEESIAYRSERTSRQISNFNSFVQKIWSAVNYSDQLLPFNITIVATNEYGRMAYLAVRGVEVMNEAIGLSVDDVLNSQQNTYVARHYAPWQPVALGPHGNPIFSNPEKIAEQGLGAYDSANYGKIEDIAAIINDVEDILDRLPL